MFFRLLAISILLAACPVHGQVTPTPALNIGDQAPAMSIIKWIKGKQVQQFEKGRIYVVEFWATWCLPCIAGMPHLSELAEKYKKDLTVAGISILERKQTSLSRIESFVDSMGKNMNYHVGAEDSNYMAKNWLNAAGERGIPLAFLIDRQGRVAWIGHPKQLDKIIPQVISGSWDMAKAAKERGEHKRLLKEDGDVITRLNPFMGNPGKPDSALLFINQLLAKEPMLKYYPRIAHFTFFALIKTDQQKALAYGRELFTKSPEDPPYKSVTDAIYNMRSVRKIPLIKELYALGAEAFQAQIDHYPWSMDIPNTYNTIAELYNMAQNKEKSISAQEQAIQSARTKAGFDQARLSEFESRLAKYKEM
jgi:thiol-disulfide isomerase/thioredoxin